MTVAKTQLTRDEVVELYVEAIRKDIDNWGALNRLIISRWSRAGLTYIKDRAWKKVYAPSQEVNG